MYMVNGVDFSKKTISIDEAIDKICDERHERNDIEIPIRDFHIGLDSDGQNIVGTINGVDYRPTLHCLKQMATWTGVSHAVLRQYMSDVLNANGSIKYKRDHIDRELLVALFKNGIRDKRIDPDKVFKFRTYTDGTLRAMLSDRYAIIDNVWYLEQIKNMLGDEPRFVHWRSDADTLWGNLLLPDTIVEKNDSGYGGMLSVSNCEIGKRRLGIVPSLFRSICTNGMIFGQEIIGRMSQVHRGNVDLHALSARLKDNIEASLPIFSTGISDFLTMRDRKLTAKPSELVAQIVQDNNLSTGRNGQGVAILVQYAQHEAGNRNMFGIVNAITRAAQLCNPEEQVKLETVGGSFMRMDETYWKNYNVRAASMDRKKHDKIFGKVSA